MLCDGRNRVTKTSFNSQNGLGFAKNSTNFIQAVDFWRVLNHNSIVIG